VEWLVAVEVIRDPVDRQFHLTFRLGLLTPSAGSRPFRI
jgi:hypothetical protein